MYRIFRRGIWRGNRDNGLKRLWFPLWLECRKTMGELRGRGLTSDLLLQWSLFKSKLKYDMQTDSIRANFPGWHSVLRTRNGNGTIPVITTNQKKILSETQS
jgi:hypothetical protein